MFTGLVQVVGLVRAARDTPGGRMLLLDAPGFPALESGASVAVNGCCQTVLESSPGVIRVAAMDETLRVTTLGELGAGSPVNLERSLRAGDEIGGHLVSGHVDGVGTLEEVTPMPHEVRVRVGLDPGLARLVARKGCLAVDGISLTVVDVGENHATVHLIPHTLDHTIARNYRALTRVNLEVDMLARYVARQMEAQHP